MRDEPSVKHVGLFATMAHRRAATMRGFQGVLFTDGSRNISEAAIWNIGFFDGTRVV